jgi:hypothetical protein
MKIEPEAEALCQKNPAAQLKKIGLIVLLAGFAIGGIIYLLFPGDASSDDDTLMTQYYKQQELDAQRLWGNQGSLVLAFTRSLKRPRTYSVIIIVLSVIFALACFYLASHPNADNEEEGKSHPPQL